MSSHADEAPDPILPALTRRKARDFHAALGQVLDQHSLKYTWNGDDSYAVDGAVFGLANLAAVVAGQPDEEWMRHIDHHVRAFITLRNDSIPDIDISMIYPRVRKARDDNETDYPLRGIVDGLEVVLAVDYPLYVSELDSLDSVTHLGPWSELWAAAMENLRRLPGPVYELVDIDGDHCALSVHAFQFEDYFGPSRILILREFIRPYFPGASSGMLVAIPDRHTLLAAEAADGGLFACGQMASIAQQFYVREPGAVTPSIYFLGADDSIAEVAHIAKDGSTYVKPTYELSKAIFPAN